MWAQKYEALAKLYAQLRKEHLDLLTKSKEYKDLNMRIGDDHRKEMDALRNEHRVYRIHSYSHDYQARGNENSDILIERNRLRDEVGRIKSQYEDELNRVRRELDDSSVSLSNMAKSKGGEVNLIVQKFNAERATLENEHRVILSLLVEY